jgi:ankyrin repeat protein
MAVIWDLDFLAEDGGARLEEVLSSGANPDEERDINGYGKETPLIFACMCQKTESVEILLKFGANPNYISNCRGTPLSIAAGLGDLELCQKLIGFGADIHLLWTVSSFLPFLPDSIKGSPLYEAANDGHTDIVSFLLKNGVNPEHIINITGNNTPLGIAAKNGHFEVVKALVQGGADVNFKGFFAPSPLFSATINNHSNIVRFLVEQGADINSRNGLLGATPLHAAQHLQHKIDPEIRQYLVEHGAVARLYLLVEILALFGIVTY